MRKRDPLLGVQKTAPLLQINLISSQTPHFSRPFWTPKSGSRFLAFLQPMQISVTQQLQYPSPTINVFHGVHLALKPTIAQLQLCGAFKATPAFAMVQGLKTGGPNYCLFDVFGEQCQICNKHQKVHSSFASLQPFHFIVFVSTSRLFAIRSFSDTESLNSPSATSMLIKLKRYVQGGDYDWSALKSHYVCESKTWIKHNVNSVTIYI